MEPAIELTIKLSGTDPRTGADITIACCDTDRWQEDIIPKLINEVLDKAEVFSGEAGLSGLCCWDVHITIGLNADGIYPGLPGFHLYQDVMFYRGGLNIAPLLDAILSVPGYWATVSLAYFLYSQRDDMLSAQSGFALGFWLQSRQPSQDR
ncbi:hypothetical protein CHU32_20940 [Superficieibacter electus]|uniref:Uncharacterized protein n=1 Tax=Superficieibacter electus TaxID=2022662 RepID=A0A2P5GK97_9ENTR|nr:hypothetical protein [Superficieibacter electus]POP43258.1 hypothetical protein CHU33_17020 [Superficieibacter electus]POP44811.1 hypothetical protein CHU32_20940 [Superficieibacter electus]